MAEIRIIIKLENNKLEKVVYIENDKLVKRAIELMGEAMFESIKEDLNKIIK